METLEQRAERLVSQEVLCCVSHIVVTLAGHSYAEDGSLIELMEQAAELASPVLASPVLFDSIEGAAQDCCEANEVEPYEREVFEHWAVSQWLADKLILKGEKVDTDFAGLCVWARTTTGQAIAMDSVIRAIARDLYGEG